MYFLSLGLIGLVKCLLLRRLCPGEDVLWMLVLLPVSLIGARAYILGLGLCLCICSRKGFLAHAVAQHTHQF